MTLSRTDRQTTALVQLLKALPEQQLIDVCTGIGATLQVDVVEAPKFKGVLCSICVLGYPLHMKRWGDDHEFQPLGGARRATTEDGDD